MKNEKLISDDFDYWMQLAKQDADEFELQRKQAIQKIIDSAPEHLKKRLEGLQWRVDSEIKLSKTPMEACVRVNQMMMKIVFEKNGFLDVLTGKHEINRNEFYKTPVTNLHTLEKLKR
jgi:hypothetical protein